MNTPVEDVNDQIAVDPEAGIAYAANFRYYRALRMSCGALIGALLVSVVGNVALAMRKPVVEMVRVDDAGRADVIRLRSSDYTAREAEIKTLINKFVVDRERLLKAVAADQFKQNYYFLAKGISQRLYLEDRDVVAKVIAGTVDEQDVEVQGIAFRNFDSERKPNGVMGSGECHVELLKVHGTEGTPVKEPWTMDLRYEINPEYAAERGLREPTFQIENPLGLTITYFHEDRAFK